MDKDKILQILNAEIERLIRARDILMGDAATSAPKRRGRPPKNPNAALYAPSNVRKKRGSPGMSPAAKKRMSEMMKKRWAERKQK